MQMNKLLYIILIYCICFEETFAYMNIPIANIKYVVVFLLFFSLIRKRVGFPFKIREKSIRMFVFIELVALIQTIPFLLDGDKEGFMYWKNFIWFPILVYLFSNMPKYSELSFSQGIRIYVNGMTLYVIANIILYYIPFPYLISDRHRYWGRLTVGYPTIDIILISLALVFLFFSKNNWSMKQMLIKGIVLFIGMCIQASGTGIVLFAIIMLLLLGYNFRFGLMHSFSLTLFRKTMIIFGSIIFIGGSSVLFYFKTTDPVLYETMELQLENRFNILTGQEEKSTLDVNTLEHRNAINKRNIKKYLNTDLKEMIGTGFGHVGMGMSDNKHVVCEDQYTLNNITIGYIGNVVYIMVLIRLLLFVFRFYKRSNNFYVYLSTWIFLVVSSFTSNSLLSFGPIAVWCMIYSFAKKEERLLYTK